MNSKHQTGAAPLSMFLLLVGFAFTLTCFLKLFPIYQDSLLVKNALKDIAAKHPNDLKELTKAQISSELSKFFMVNNVRDPAIDVNRVTLDRLRDKTVFHLNYEVRINFMKNIDLVVWFNNELDSSKPEACCKPSETIKK